MANNNPINLHSKMIENENNLQVIEELNELRNLVAAVKSQGVVTSPRGEQLLLLSNALERRHI